MVFPQARILGELPFASQGDLPDPGIKTVSPALQLSPVWAGRFFTAKLPGKELSGDSDKKETVCNAGDLSSVLGFRRSPGEGSGYILQYSCLENSMDRGPGGLQFIGSESDMTK